MFFGNIPSVETLNILTKQLTQGRIEHWLSYELFSYQWWLLVILLVVPWFIWWKYVDRKRLTEISLLGAIILIFVTSLDATLTDLALWTYDYKLIPLWPIIIPVDFTVLPIIYMFTYQYFQEWKRFLPAMTIVSILLSYVAEPGLTWLNIYQLHGWKHLYSLPLYIIMGIFVKWLVQKVIVRKNIEALSLD